MKKITYIIATALLAFSCDNSSYYTEPFDNPTDPYLIVVNEGNYGYSNSDISYITKNEEVTNKVFEAKNGRTVGDVAQSVTKINNYYYIAISNSQKIEVVSADDFSEIATIYDDSEYITPQYIIQTAGSEAIMSDLYSTKMAIIDLSYNRILSYKEVGAGTGKMYLSNSLLYVAKYDDSTWCYDNIMILDSGSLNQVGEISTPGMGKSDILEDNTGKIWAMTTGGFVRIDPSTYSIVKTVPLPSEITNVWGSHCGITSDGRTIVFTSPVNGESKVYSFDVEANTIGDAIFTATEIDNIYGSGAYGLAISPDDQIFMTDAIDYVQSGKVYEYDFSGEVVNAYTVGISPQHMIFVD